MASNEECKEAYYRGLAAGILYKALLQIENETYQGCLGYVDLVDIPAWRIVRRAILHLSEKKLLGKSTVEVWWNEKA